MKISPARVAAFDILLRIEREAAYSSALLAAVEPELSGLDRGLCHQLTLGTLRRQIPLDRLIESLTNGRKIDAEVRVALRLALYQILYLTKIPAHSAVNESVNLVTRARKKSAKAFVNGVLRNALRTMPELTFADEIDRVSVSTSHPRWLIEKWITDLGFEAAESRAVANNVPPTPAFRAVRPDSRVDELIARSRVSKHVSNCFLLEQSDRLAIGLAEEGAIFFQDEASQLAAQAVTIPSSGSFIDLCAAPGGKTTQTAARFNSEAGLIAAGDIHHSRARLLRSICESHLPGRVAVLRLNAAGSLPFADGTFDTVLLDAPCSGTGTIRNNPEIRYRVAPDDFKRLASEQLSMLKNASKLLKPNGVVHYSTCSLEPEENEDVCRRFLDHAADAERLVPQVPGEFFTADGFARTRPDRDGMDGFFIAAFRKN